MEKGNEIRDCNFERETGIGNFTKQDSRNDTQFLGKWVENVQRESSCNFRECQRVVVHFLQPSMALSPTYHAVIRRDSGLLNAKDTPTFQKVFLR